MNRITGDSHKIYTKLFFFLSIQPQSKQEEITESWSENKEEG